MSRTKSRAYDFSELADYKSAIKVLRRFAPEKFTAEKYPLRGINQIKDYTSAQQKNIREYMRFVRPLIVYGYKLKRVDDPNQLRAMYSGLYGLKKIPSGLKRIPMQVGADDRALKVDFERYTLSDDDTGLSRDFDLAIVQVSPGVRVARLHFDDIGFEWGDLTGADLRDTIDYIWQTWKPQGVAIQAGVSVVKKEGAPNLYYSAASLYKALSKLQNQYNGMGDKSNYMDWLHGIDLYYFKENAPLDDFIFAEKRRYDARALLAKDMANLRDKRRRAIKKMERELRSARRLLRRVKSNDSKREVKREIKAIEKEGIRILQKLQLLINELSAQMYYTESF